MLKGDEFRGPSFWRFQAVGWGCFYLLSILVVLPYLQHPSELGYEGVGGLLWDQGLMGVCAFFASLALRAVCRSLVRRTSTWIKLEVHAAGWSLLLGICTGLTAARLIVAKLERVDMLEGCVKMSVLLFLWCNLYFSIKRSQQQEQEHARLLRAEAQGHEAQLRALRYQLNPHFLFNSMNAVSTLVAEGNGRAAIKMLAEIAAFLRIALDGQAVPELPLAQELLLTERYLAIEHARLGERLHVELDIAPETLKAYVPSLLLQPLVENAVRHGIAPLVEGGKIVVRSELRDSRVHITVVNSGRPTDRTNAKAATDATSIGLANTAERLRTLYGVDHCLVLEWPATGGCQVVVQIPFRAARDRIGANICAC